MWESIFSIQWVKVSYIYINILGSLYKIVHYKTVFGYKMNSDIRLFKVGPQNVVSKQKMYRLCIDYIETKMYRFYRKMTIYGHFSI